MDPGLKIGSYFAPVVDAFVGSGWTVGKDLHAAPYDWRLASDGLSQPLFGDTTSYYDKLQSLIESTVKRAGAPAVVITHSMGG